MDPSIDINSVSEIGIDINSPNEIDITVTANMNFQRELSGLPPLAAGTQQETPGAIFIAGIPVISHSTLLAGLRPIFMPLGINVDSLLEQTPPKTDDVEEAEAGDDEHKCSICLGPYVLPTAIKVCGHVFCASCIAQAFKKKEKKCPKCRTKATKRHLLQIYL